MAVDGILHVSGRNKRFSKPTKLFFIKKRGGNRLKTPARLKWWGGGGGGLELNFRSNYCRWEKEEESQCCIDRIVTTIAPRHNKRVSSAGKLERNGAWVGSGVAFALMGSLGPAAAAMRNSVKTLKRLLKRQTA